MSEILSHSVTAWSKNIHVLDQIMQRHVLIFGGAACESAGLRIVFLLSVSMCIDAYVIIGSYVLCASTH